MTQQLIRLAREHGTVVGNAADLAARDTETVLRIAAQNPSGASFGLVREAIPEIMATYGAVIATVDVDYYDNLRAEANVDVDYAAQPKPQNWRTVAAPISGFAISRTIDELDFGATTTLVAGNVASELFNSHRETIAFNANRDPARPKYRRITRPGACDFCLYMATGFEGDGSNEQYKNFHTNCRCVDVAIFSGQRFVEPPYYDEFRSELAIARSRIQERRIAARAVSPGMRDRDFFRQYPDTAITTPNLVREVRRVRLGQPNNPA